MKANKKSQEYEDDALSSVLGVVLMVAAVVVTASAVYAYANDMIDIPPEVAPKMTFVAMDSNMYSSTIHINTLTIAHIDSATTLLWGDLKITSDNGDCTVPYDDNAEVTKYDVITCPTTECRLNIIHEPTNTLIARFTFDSDRDDDGSDLPIANDDNYNTNEDITLNVAAPGVLGNDVDYDGPETLTAFLDDDVDYGSLTFNSDGSFEYTPDPDWSGIDSFTYHAFDDMDNSNIATVTITIVEISDPCNCSEGPRTQGYWKTHPDAWPMDTITIGGISYTKDEAIAILRTPIHDNMTIDMFHQLVAAKLNVANCCNSSCIEDTIIDADNWMVTYPLGSGVSGSSPAWEEGEPLKAMLDEYNNG